MKILFLTLLDFDTYSERNIYTDILREFIKNGHEVYCISPIERRTGKKTHFEEEGHLLKLRIGNIQKTNIIEKGISTLRIESQFVSAIKKYFSNVKFNLVLYSTPPITFANVIKYVKNRDGAKTYLMLKDIFPQNAVDIGMMKTTGLKGLIYKYFRKKEKALYSLSDRIGCMSQANADYVIKHNPTVPPEIVEVCPNCIEICDAKLNSEERTEMRKKYGLPIDKKIFVYGGNLGKPQDVPYIINSMRKCAETDAYFVIAGSGTDAYLFEKYIEEENPSHVRYYGYLPKDEYDKMIACCDVGLIFLDHRFTIPNFPSRLLSYMQAGLPVLACTDTNTDIGKVIVDGGFGWWCESVNVDDFYNLINSIDEESITTMGSASLEYLKQHYAARNDFEIITRK